MPFKVYSFDALAFIATFAYYHDPALVIRKESRVGKYGIVFGVMNQNTPRYSAGGCSRNSAGNPIMIPPNFICLKS
ncbi:MAG: hypothetical protein ACOCTU_04410 [Bacteroidota bacterium]